MSEQHIYEGEGNPFDLGIHAKAGSHYIDTARDDHVWLSTFHDPVQPYTTWIKLEQVWATDTGDSPSWVFSLPVDGRTSAVMQDGGQVTFVGDGVIFSNVEVTAVDGVHVYSSDDPFMFSVVPGNEAGEAIFTVTPMFKYTQG